MDKNRIEGAVRQVKGSVKEAAGKISGNRQLEVEGKSDKLAGEAQSALGKAKDNVKDALR
ncbi:CsbD family protein [Rhizobium sp. WL3]|jgi:uncharacterized protein YjbJ (UPF0337 family)|uniref:CsbD family protein n=1 Tax=Rhizobium rhizophilum TaxID=1850373 RepID=A0ABY2QSN4_9HYPH|nr:MULTISPECIES: CsbD family protein [Rhizobium]MBX9468282.1 CsbD family protein [Rhizobium sp.]QEE47704.1 CsbD family protein [Rhizobium sp. WL3]THV13603.1 CsbD family protein [Rhizobium rhizophilum]